MASTTTAPYTRAVVAAMRKLCVLEKNALGRFPGAIMS